MMKFKRIPTEMMMPPIKEASEKSFPRRKSIKIPVKSCPVKLKMLRFSADTFGTTMLNNKTVVTPKVPPR